MHARMGRLVKNQIKQAPSQAVSDETILQPATDSDERPKVFSPKREIVRYAHEIHPDLVIMGAHGHGGLKDLIFGNTINPVRHDLDIPMLIVRPGKT